MAATPIFSFPSGNENANESISLFFLHAFYYFKKHGRASPSRAVLYTN
jgi:hypothetical protein